MAPLARRVPSALGAKILSVHLVCYNFLLEVDGKCLLYEVGESRRLEDGHEWKEQLIVV